MKLLRFGKVEQTLIFRKVVVNPWLVLSWLVSAMQELPERSQDYGGFVSAGARTIAPVSGTAYERCFTVQFFG